VIADVLGTPIFVGDVASGASWVIERSAAGSGGYVCLCNVHLFVAARHDDEVRRALENASMVFPDGWPIAWLQRRLGYGSASRVAGPDLMARVLADGRGFELRHHLLGSTDSVLRRLEANLGREYPGAKIVGTLSLPFFDRAEHVPMQAAIGKVRRSGPDVVWLALGCPKQELWMLRYAAELAPAVVVGVGAAFDFHAGTKRRAPLPVQKAGLEWLYRLSVEPRRLAGRYVRTNAEFLFVAGRALLARKDRRGAP
jgi:N-acetylglucosaminyldiphosphoundecaprenol N-acetyl-beta-D-mannosaminyltransferase